MESGLNSEESIFTTRLCGAHAQERTRHININGRLILIYHQCWEVLSFLTIQRQRCIKILCPKDPEFYTPLALNCQKGQHLPALEVYKIQFPNKHFFPVTARVGGLPRPVGQGSNVYVLCAEPKEHQHFRPGTRPGGSATGCDPETIYVPMFMCLCWPLHAHKRVEGIHHAMWTFRRFLVRS